MLSKAEAMPTPIAQCPHCKGTGWVPAPGDLISRLREKADEVDESVARDKTDRDQGSFGEIELMREAADEIERLRKLES